MSISLFVGSNIVKMSNIFNLTDGNMYIFPTGSGCTGEPTLVKPGDELFGHNCPSNIIQNIEETKEWNQLSIDMSDIVMQSNVKLEANSR